MGFFSFLTRKSANSDKASAPPIKAQAYDSTVAALPPILGTYPVAGNGPNILDQLQRAARKRSEAQLRRANDASAAPPPITRQRGSSMGRPRTAPNNSNVNSRPRSVARSARWPLLPEQPQVPFSNGAYELNGVPPVPSIHKHRRQSSSFDSFHGHSYVDVLDAQGEIKPSNFRSRLSATGAREYGEDVADRNLGENAVDIGSPAAKAFYARSNSGSLSFRHEGRSRGHYEEVYEEHQDDDFDESAPPPIVARGELAKDEWTHRLRKRASRDIPQSRPKSSKSTKSISASPWASFSKVSDMPPLDYDMARSVEQYPPMRRNARNLNHNLDESLAKRRRSFNAFASPPPEVRSRPRPLSLHPSMSNFSNRSMSPPPIPPMSQARTRSKSAAEKVMMEQFIEFCALMNLANAEAANVRQSQYAREAPSVYSVASSAPTQRQRATKRKSMGALPRRPSSHGRSRGTHRAAVEMMDDDASDSAAPSPMIFNRPRVAERPSQSRPGSSHNRKQARERPREQSHTMSRPSSSSSVDRAFPRTLSMGGAALPPRGRLDDINEHIPVRTSSLMNVAQPCLTPTTMSSGYSSTQFGRPQSQQTANTSIDASFHAKSVKSGHERNASDSSASADIEYMTAAEEDFPADIPRRHKTLASNGKAPIEPIPEQESPDGLKKTDTYGSFADYTDDSEDSFIYKKPGAEEGLLFNDAGYGDVGKGLPGLFDALSGPSSPIVPQTPTSVATKPGAASNRSTPKGRPKLRHSHSLPFSYANHMSAPGYGSDEESSDSFFDPEFEYLRKQPFSEVPDIRIETPGRTARYSIVEEEDEDRIDARMASKLRKDVAKQRSRTVSNGRHVKSKSLSRRRYQEEGHAADTEDWGPYR